MSNQWNSKQFDEFVCLRDQFRAAKRSKSYQNVLSIGLQILELDKTAKFIQIATSIFLKDMGDACLILGDKASAVKYFEIAIEKIAEGQVNMEDWQNQIDSIEKKLKKLRANL